MDNAIYNFRADNGTVLPLKLTDNGDGTFSLSTSGGSGGAGSGLTNTELRATPVPVSGGITDTQLRATAVPVSGPLTDTQLRLTALSVTIPASELHLGMVSGQGDSFPVEFTRPNDATPYAVNDVVGPAVTGLLDFGTVSRVNGGSAYIVKARLLTNQAANVASYRLHLYEDSTPTAIADNAVFTLLWANRAVRLGFIDFDACATEGSGSDAAFSLNKDIRLHIKCLSNSRHIYGVLVTKTIFTPATNQVYYISLSVEQD